MRMPKEYKKVDNKIMILIIYADNMEKQEISWKLIKKGTFSNYDYELYLYKNKKIVVAKSGVGVTCAAACTELFINKFKPSKILNFGAAGGSPKFNQYDIAIPNKIYFYDVKTPWYPLGQIPYNPKFFINKISNNCNINLGTGMTFINDKKQIDDINQQINVDIFDMECAAIAQICFKNKVDLYVVKGISDIIGQTNDEKKNINNCIKKASKLAFNKIIQYI